ncbi:MAG: TolC family protein [Lysobacterales bacterium]
MTVCLALLLARPLWAEDYAARVQAYLEAGRGSNLALQAASADVERAQAVLDEARARYRPSVSLSARYSRADGGRTQPLPVGDLVNPAYRTLNELLQAQGQPARFTDIDNQQIAFLREREQDTKLSLTQPLYAPAIAAGIEAAEAGHAASAAARAAYERTLERDIEVAYLDWLRAREALRIVEASRELLNENLRVNRVLHENGKITRDQVLRAEAEVLAVEQQQLDADNSVTLARNYFNFLLNRPLDAEIEATASPDPEGYVQQRLAALGLSLERLDDGKLEQTAERGRAELLQLDASVRAAGAAVALERASYLPTLAFALDAGIQGEDYGFGPGQNYAMASLVLDWRLADFGQRRSRVQAAGAQRERAEHQAEDVRLQIKLQVRQAADRLRTVRASLQTAAARQQAAAEAFRIAARKRDAGSIAQVEFIDARTTLTGAELNLNLTRFDVLVRLAELRAALGSS